jgi:hypothetical protein|tara:strand:- start:455 stop:619 length:165 start_codon:yes stop_codon:yes gene_type:complete
MKIENAKYIESEKRTIAVTIDDVITNVPVAVGNRHYDEIKRRVDTGELTIADAD